jgi:DNA polymerase
MSQGEAEEFYAVYDRNIRMSRKHRECCACGEAIKAGHRYCHIYGMGLRREQTYLANIVKCRPPDNRVPAPDEVEACTPYLVKQLEIIRPKVIVTLGLPSAKYMLASKLSMGKLRGQWHNWRGIKLMPTYHPAFLLRAYTEENRAAVWSDLKKVLTEVGLPIPGKSAK